MVAKALFDQALSDEINTHLAITKRQAEVLFNFFKDHYLFLWNDAQNNCENRANAICILLDEWNIQNGKGWVFSGYIFNKIGYLKNLWKYHVGALVPVSEGGSIKFYIIDPATSETLLSLEDWAAGITDNPHSYYMIKDGHYYIFNEDKIKKNNWYQRDRRNYNWTMQGLSGINSISHIGKAKLTFNKKKVPKTRKLFNELKNSKPVLY